MRIACVGAGIAGLAFSAALKQSHPGYEIEIFGELAQPLEPCLLSSRFFTAVAPKLRLLLGGETDAAVWRDVTIIHSGQPTAVAVEQRGSLRCRDLAASLREAAESRGCLFRSDVGADLCGYDLVVSERHDDRLSSFSEPVCRAGRTRRAILEIGALDREIYELVRTRSGLFFGQAFPMPGGRGMFVVEAADEAWDREGLLDAAPDALAAFCGSVFSPPPGPWGAVVVAGLHQPRIERHKRLHNGSVVLVGDAAHRFHHGMPAALEISIGDGLALAACLQASDSVPAALARYEKQRHAVAESGHRASDLCLDWVENLDRHADLPPARYAFALMTRSLRVNHHDLRRQDPAFVAAVDRQFAGDADPPPPMFVPFTLRGLTLQNRIGAAPLCMYSAANGSPTDFHMAHLGAFALGGAGLVFTEMTAVSPEARITPGCAGIYRPEHVESWRRIVAMVHAVGGAKTCLQLGHAGRRGSTKRPWDPGPEALEEGGWERLAPSVATYSDSLPVQRAMSRRDIDKVIEDYARAARMAGQAGFDMLEVHMAHGYLLSSFLSPLSNLRTDEFGGSVAARARFPLMVLAAVREVWADKPLSVRISAVDWSGGGTTVDQAVEIAHLLKRAGADIIGVSSGNVVNVRRPATGRLFQAPFSDRVRNDVKIPTMSFGRISSLGDINALLAAGRADLCLLGKGHLYDPYFTRHAARQLGYDAFRLPNPHLTAREFMPRAG